MNREATRQRIQYLIENGGLYPGHTAPRRKHWLLLSLISNALLLSLVLTLVALYVE